MAVERVLALAVVSACAMPQPPSVLCHNANCAGGAIESEDDTLPALDASLALGPSMLDGVELDFSWETDHAVFAHAPHDGAPLWRTAAQRVADYLGDHGGLTSTGQPFLVYIELKPSDTGAEGLADSVVDAARLIGERGPFDLAVSSFSPVILRAAGAKLAAVGIEVRLVAERWLPNRWSLAEFDHLDGISVHAHEIDRTNAPRYADLGLDVAIWTDLDTPALFTAIELAEPRYVSVARVEAVRHWLDR